MPVPVELAPVALVPVELALMAPVEVLAAAVLAAEDAAVALVDDCRLSRSEFTSVISFDAAWLIGLWLLDGCVALDAWLGSAGAWLELDENGVAVWLVAPVELVLCPVRDW